MAWWAVPVEMKGANVTCLLVLLSILERKEWVSRMCLDSACSLYQPLSFITAVRVELSLREAKKPASSCITSG